MRVLGIDPGLRTLGWGVIEVLGSRISHVGNGLCRSSGDDLAIRLLSLFDQLSEIVTRYAPEAAAVEQTFVNKDGAGTLKLGQARGIAMLVPARAGLVVGEYAPNTVKKTVVGVGHADKRQSRSYGAPATAGGADRRGGRGGCVGYCAVSCPSCTLCRSAGRGLGAGQRMIGRIAGRLDYRGPDHVLIDVQGVGYIVFVSDRTLAALPGVGEAVALYTDLLVREDLLQLFGFTSLVEKEWHRLLMSVQGIGAKASMAILGTLGPEGVGRAINLGDATAVKAAPGVGPKIAQRVVNELRDKAPAVMAMGGAFQTAVDALVEPVGSGVASAAAPPPGAARPTGSAAAQAEALSALGNLGYGPGEAAGAVAEAAAAESDAETPALIRAALKLLAPKG